MESSSILHLRPANRTDIDLIIQLIRELAVYEKLEDQARPDAARLENSLFGEKAFAEVLLAEWNGKPAGFALFFHNFSTFAGKPGLYLEDLFVRKEYRGKGIGKAFMKKLAEIASERDCGRMEWAVLNWNPAREFYRKLGAVHLQEWMIYRMEGAELQQLTEEASSPGDKNHWE